MDEQGIASSAALDAALAINDAWSRMNALMDASDKLTSDKQRSVLLEALTAARTISDESSRASALSLLSDRLPRDAGILWHELLRDAAVLAGESQSTQILSSLIPYWQAMFDGNVDKEVKAISGVLRSFVRTGRPQTLRAIQALLPAIARLGKTPAMHDIALAITDTAKWWP
jgi:hypothetical protein